MSRQEAPIAPRFFGCPKWLGFQHDGYSLAELKDYLEIRRLKHPPTEGEPVRAKSAEELAASTQSLLTFGLLESVIWEHVPENTMVMRDSLGNLVLSRKNLVGLMEAWIDRIGRCKGDEAGQWLERANTNLETAHSLMLNMAKFRFREFNPLGTDAPSMIYLVALIGEALANARMVFRESARQGLDWSWVIWAQENPNAVMEEMVADGWCPSVVQYLVTTASLSSLGFAMANGPAKDGKDHADCSNTACSRYVVVPETYIAKHLPSCPSSASPSDKRCKFSAPVFKHVEELLLEKQFPIITLVEGPDPDSVELSVHRSTELPYVAISHVWADGLGSKTEDGLPACQLRRLAALASRVRPGAAIWLDGICIPGANNLRKEAIGLMARTYREASAVLVLDAGLQHCQATEPLGVKALRVLTSGWMRRLWTLQEALFAKELHLVFADDNLLLLRDVIPSPREMLLHQHLTDLASELFRLTKLSRYKDYRIGDAARSLRWRTTNRPSDETLAIASLLGVQPAALVDLKADERMMYLLRAIGRIPKNILFLPGSKLPSPGFRWAPTSFMAAHAGNHGGAMLSTQESDARLTARGLEAMYHAFAFPSTTFLAGREWKLKDVKSGRLYRVTDPLKGKRSYTCDMLLLNQSLSVGGNGLCVAVLLNRGATSVRADNSFTAYCEYQRRLLILEDVASSMFGGDAEDAILSSVSGRMNVCVA
ncbi:hypothetical protein RB598_000317 [Gaeumannomyces tritici]